MREWVEYKGPGTLRFGAWNLTLMDSLQPGKQNRKIAAYLYRLAASVMHGHTKKVSRIGTLANGVQPLITQTLTTSTSVNGHGREYHQSLLSFVCTHHQTSLASDTP